MIHRNCKCKEVILDEKQIEYLSKIGLSKSAINLYNKMLILGPLSAQDAATHTFDFPSAHYRLFYALENKDLIKRIQGRPIKFEPLPIKTGLKASYVDTRQELANLIKATNKNPEQDKANIILGRQAVYDIYTEYATRAQEKIYIFSIGIAYSEKLHKTQQEAISRGVKVYHVVQEVKPANYHVIHKWKKIGINIKELRQSRGYHLVVIDDTCSIVTFSSPDDTEDRVSILSENKSIVAIFDQQFESIWDAAQKIKL